jgi:hypothetical protein
MMQTFRRFVVVIALCGLSAGAAIAKKPDSHTKSCPGDLAATVAQQCPCDGAPSHGAFVSCVMGARKALLKAGCPRATVQTVVRCAVRSTCGRADAVLCCVGKGPAMRVARDAGSCQAAGGTAMGQGSVCQAECAAPGASTSSTTTTSMPATTSMPPSTSTTTTSSSTTSSTTTTLAAGTNYGNDVEFAAASAHSPGYLLGVPVAIPAPSVLTHLCLIAKAGGANVVLALYASDASGWPSQLVASTAATPVTPGMMQIPVPPTAIAAGTYWIAGVYDADASIGMDETDGQAPVVYTALDFSMPLPDPAADLNEYWGQRFNYFLTVQ